MGNQPTQVQQTVGALRGTPVEVWSKSEGRWIQAVIGAPKDVREPPPESTAVLVLFKDIVGGRTDAYKWVQFDDVAHVIRARPEAKRQAGMMDTMAESNFATTFEHRSAFEERPAAPVQQMCSMGPMASIPGERPQQQQSVMSSIMASVGVGAALPPSAMGSMAPSMASTVDQNSSRLDRRPNYGHPMGGMQTSIPEERPGFMSTIMSGPSPMVSAQQERPGFMSTIMSGPSPMVSAQQHHPSHTPCAQPQAQQGGVLTSLMSIGGSLPASLMGSANGSMTSMVSYGENKSPNRTPLGSMNGKVKGPDYSNPMSSFMSSMGFTVESAPEPRPATMPAMKPRRQVNF